MRWEGDVGPLRAREPVGQPKVPRELRRLKLAWLQTREHRPL